MGGSTCFAMAHMMQIEMGETGERQRISIDNINQVQAGDCLHYYYPNGDEHWVYVFEVQGNTISIGEGNAYDPNTGSLERVNYRTMDFSEFGSGRLSVAEIDRAK